MKIVKRRSLGCAARTKLVLTVVISLALWWVATEQAGITTTMRLRFVDASVDLGFFFPILVFLVIAGSDQRGQPHRRPRRPRRRLRRRS